MVRVVALSGHNGFIGSHLARALEASGCETLALRRSGHELVAPVGTRLDAVVHLAFPTAAADRRDDPVGALRSAVGTTLSALAIAVESGAQQFILASSGKVYASPPTLPIGEDHPVAPVTWLGELKLACEQMVQLSMRCQAAFGASVLRMFNVYGPGQRTDFVVPHLLSAIGGRRISIGETEHGRDFIHVDDVCRAFTIALQHPPDRGTTRVMNVGSGRSTTLAELAAMIEAATGEKLDLVVDPARRRPDESAREAARCGALDALGFDAAIPLEQGIARLARAALG